MLSPFVKKELFTRLLSRLKRFCSSSQRPKYDPDSDSRTTNSNKAQKPTSGLDQMVSELDDSTDISRPTSANTGPFINLPGEVRNIIYKFAFNTSFSTDQLPDTHRLPSCYLLALTCRQIYHEVHEMVDSNILVYGFHTMRIRFFQQLPPERLSLMKAVILPESGMGNSWTRYHDWRNGIYECVVEKLCASRFQPTTLIFCTDCQRSQMSGHVAGISNEARNARFANALQDLRFTLATLCTVRTVYIVNVGAPWFHNTRDSYADMFEKYFPSDVDKVQNIAQGFTSLYYHGILDGSEKWGVRRERIPLRIPLKIPWGCNDSLPQGSIGVVDNDLFVRTKDAEDSTADFCLTRTDSHSPPSEVAVHIFANWPDFCKAYDGPYRLPKRDGNPTIQGTATKYNMRQPSWHLGPDV